ncbi:flagellar hook-associated protein FlgK [Terriglobus saanensis]|uniref:Flagellar hook-associated protein 1 n=1 Tax=Terriglobus saanensis (strain ATCC BAA-1853 / DSM 23119 / SP1PR4) TaxID=401053 RepID=E8V5N6_TERSS|nr:flagellar hook-associated protein FlgK [Terriglobus saanensis]ADV82645.1 flagellar hook-associated protein FlgK [Terriglobus saanensis SP1PR4]
MGSLTSLLSIARQALANSQTAIDATGTNISNQHTVGYTRKTAVFAESDTVDVGGSLLGSGATVTIVSQRDRILEQRMQQQTQADGQTSARLTALQSVDSIFQTTTSSADASGIGSSLDAFFNSFSALEANPTDGATRQAVLTSAQTFATAIQAASSQLTSQATDLGQQVSGSVAQVNQLTSQIAALNGKISSTSPDADAGDLEDQRQELITQLSGLVGLSQSSTANNGIALTTTNGTPLVGGNISYNLTAQNVGGSVHVFGQQNGVSTDITSALSGGSIAGDIQARDVDIASAQTSLDTLAFDVATAVNTQNSAGKDENGAVGGNIFGVPSSASGAAASLTVSLTDPAGIAAASGTDGAGGSTNATALAALGSGKIVGGETPASFFGSFLTQLGTTISGATTDETVTAAELTQATAQRNALSGVSLDEEASNLTEYQRSYQAAAKVFSIVDEMFASAINLGVESAVS